MSANLSSIAVFLTPEPASKFSGELAQTESTYRSKVSESANLGWDSNICICNQFPQDNNAESQKTRLWDQPLYRKAVENELAIPSFFFS